MAPEIQWTLPVGYQAATATAQTVVNASDVTAVRQVDAGTTGTVTATSSLSAAPLGNLTLSVMVRPGTDAPPGPDPDPPPPPPPPTSDPTHARVSGSTLLLDGVNPGTGGTGGDAGFPGYRGPNQLILYTDPEVTVTITNQWGAEVSVNSSNVVTAVNDRQTTGSGTGTSVPSGGYVLSGHGTARDWLLANATVSATVELLVEGGGPLPDPDPDPGSGYPARAVSCYKKIWSSDSAISNIPTGANVIRPAFAQGSPPALVGGTTAGTSAMVATLATRRIAGTRVIASIGGAGGAINTSDRTGFMSGIASIKAALEGSAGGGLDGIDWDIEASSLNQADVVWISSQLKTVYGATFAITFVPNGGNVGTYLPAAVACQQAGALDEYGQQFYDSNVSLAAAKGRISEALGAGLPQSKMSVGMMTTADGNGDANHWSLAQCRSYMADIVATWPGITKAYIWTEDDQLTSGAITTWVADMRAAVGL